MSSSAIEQWGGWVLEEAKKEIGRFYPVEEDGSIPVGYIWARTIPCQNPGCGAEIPLMRQYWLAKKDKKKVALFPHIGDGAVRFRILGDGYEEMPEGFDPKNGTVARAVATCPVCGSVVDAKTTRRMFQEGKGWAEDGGCCVASSEEEGEDVSRCRGGGCACVFGG